MMRRWKAATLLIVAMTLGGTAAIPGSAAANSEAKTNTVQDQSAPVRANKPAVVYSWDFRAEFYDKETGRTYYNASVFNGNEYDNRTIFRDSEGQWHALEEGLSIRWDFNLNKPVLWSAKLNDSLDGPFATIYYPSNETAIRGVYFTGSKDNLAGLRYLKNYTPLGSGNSSSDFILLQRTRDGAIRQIESLPYRPRYLPMPDGKLLAVQYSNIAKMNEILIIDPLTGAKKHLTYASLDFYDVKGGRLLINYNKPERPRAVITLVDGTERPATEQDWQEFSNLQSDNLPPMPVAGTQPPADLQPQELPVTQVQIHDRLTARATIGGQVVHLSFAFIRDGRTVIPVRDLMEQTDLEVKQEKVAGEPGSNSFTLTGPGGTVTLTGSNIFMIRDHLFVGSDILKRVGLPVQGIHWNP